MDLKSALSNKWLGRVIVVVWIACTASTFFMFYNLDQVMNTTSYEYGLQFSTEWANPYWMYLRLTYGFLFLSSGLGFIALMIGLSKSNPMIKETLDIAQTRQKQPVISNKRKIKEEKPIPKIKPARRDENNMVISCPNCRKVFSRPLVMLNFEGGKTRLVNVCPYCNHSLGQAADNGKSNIEFQVREPEEEKWNQKR